VKLLVGRPSVRPGDQKEATRLRSALKDFQSEAGPLPGLTSGDRCDVFVAQLIESQRRNRYIERLRNMDLSSKALDGNANSFDPLKGAILQHRNGDHDEACWLVFLSVHFGKNQTTGWQLAGDFYGRLGDGGNWDWVSTSGDVLGVRGWLDSNYGRLRSKGGKFGNHRKYESLGAWTDVGTGNVVATYADWVGVGTHAQRFAEIAPPALTPHKRFAALYTSLRPVARFGRTARFDFLSMLGKLDLTEVEADCAHLAGATGPLTGARLLFDGDKRSTTRASTLEARLLPVQQAMDVTFDVLEDALCNWQKSPGVFVPFRG
jgi:hypothetical protein